TRRGSLGTVTQLVSGVVVDPQGKLYAVGRDAGSQLRLYTMSLSSWTTTSAPVADAYTLVR
ncbi:MAG: hypothetical protein ACXWLM_07280, partial [Myxococcales bacterium]